MNPLQKIAMTILFLGASFAAGTSFALGQFSGYSSDGAPIYSDWSLAPGNSKGGSYRPKRLQYPNFPKALYCVKATCIEKDDAESACKEFAYPTLSSEDRFFEIHFPHNYWSEDTSDVPLIVEDFPRYNFYSNQAPLYNFAGQIEEQGDDVSIISREIKPYRNTGKAKHILGRVLIHYVLFSKVDLETVKDEPNTNIFGSGTLEIVNHTSHPKGLYRFLADRKPQLGKNFEFQCSGFPFKID